MAAKSPKSSTKMRKNSRNSSLDQILNFSAVALVLSLVCDSQAAGACDRTRKVFEDVSYGEITDGLNANYTQDSHCEWLIQAKNSSQFITLRFHSLKTECSYDYIFIYDGNSYDKSPLLGTFSGQTDPEDITAVSGSMLILLYSDTNYNLDGFRATFFVTNCLNNCSSNGLCVDHTCRCTSDFTGADCSTKACENCALQRLDTNDTQWLWLSSSLGSFTPRAAHSAVYDAATDAVYAFGGYDLNRVLAGLEVFRFADGRWVDEEGEEVVGGAVRAKSESNEWWFNEALLSYANVSRAHSSLRGNDSRPAPRYGHAACMLNDTFLVFGGKLADGSLSNELWQFNISTRAWSLRALNSRETPPPLTRHTLTYVDLDGFVYLFGGSLSDGEFSSQMFRIKVEAGEEQWEAVRPRGGKSFDHRIVAHTTVYHPATRSLVIYGGIIAGVARFSKLSDRMFSFDLVDRHFTEIFYPRKDSVPRERAFHTATIYGDYMLVFGGYSHRHNKEEICYDNQIYLYNLACHLWVNRDVLGDQKYGKRSDENRHLRYPKKQGVFAHAAMLRRHNQLLIHGGYHGSVNSDFLAFIAPNMTNCSLHRTSTECIANPACGYCSYDSICYPRTSLSTCYTNLQTTRCHGICPTLRDCRSCLRHGNGACKWCVQTGKCNSKSDRAACGEGENYERVGAEIEDAMECAARDRPPGLVYLKYLQPYDFSQPDYVGVINTTTVEFSTSTAPSIDSSNSGEVIARLHGFVRAPAAEMVKICGTYADIKIAVDNRTLLNFTADHSICQPMRLHAQKTLVDLQARRHKPQIHIHSKVGIQRNSSKPFTAEFLEPFGRGDCGSYLNCRHCLSDAECGWCDIIGACVSRESNETSVCRESSGDHWRYLIVNADQCVNCSNFISCQSCATEAACEWWNDDTKCERRGRSPTGVKSPVECASACHERASCEQCLNDKGKCVWCQETQQCFSFSIYTSEYQFGLCREWIDQLIVGGGGGDTHGHHQCKSCGMFRNCSTCLRSLNCGWCFVEENPIEGACVDGDFSGAAVECSSALNTSEPVQYSYAECPDLDECSLDIHDCHPNADCHNTRGSYVCQCRKGFLGDGKRKCDKTCDDVCMHGHCSNFPDYKCICDLGWTGADCSINCQCNNHSTCVKGVGICDECQDHTEGVHCEKCVVGSFGNATAGGCQPCSCNGHADKSAGLCDPKTGKCFCVDNTEGENCELCARNFYGDPKDSGRCYLQCQSRALLQETAVQGIGSFGVRTSPGECLWLLKLDASVANGSLIQFEVDDTMNVSCHSNAIYTFASVAEFSDKFGHKKLLNAVCDSASVVSESRTGEMAVYFRRTARCDGFNAVVRILSCGLGTCTPPFVCNGTRCACPPERHGPRCEHAGSAVCAQNCDAGTSVRVRELFSTQSVDKSLRHLRKTLPRFGNSVSADRRGFLWIFGGFSLTNGALNDIRQFDTKNRTWVQVTVDGTASKMPLGRFFHAAEIKAQSVFVHGGLGNDFEVFADLWEFNIHEQRWSELEGGREDAPGPLAGHTMNVIKEGEGEALVVVGGYRGERRRQREAASTEQNEASASESTESEQQAVRRTTESDGDLPKARRRRSGSAEPEKRGIVFQYDFERKAWSGLKVVGNPPELIFGHTTSYHVQAQVLYIFGGYQAVGGRIQMANRLYTLRKVKNVWTWNLLPTFDELNRPEENLPRARFLHSAIPFANFLAIHGGATQPANASDTLNAYVYKCNSYIRLSEGVEMSAAATPQLTHARAVAVDSDTFYVVGGISSQFSIHSVTLPVDICQLFSSSKHTCRTNRGCSFATTTFANSTARLTECFSSDQKETKKSELTSTAFNWGSVCDEMLLGTRNCSSFVTCDECATVFPHESGPSCKWSSNKRCYNEKRPKNETEPQKCEASVSNYTVSACAGFGTCASCLAVGAAGGRSCVWSTKVSRCIDADFTPLLCAGAICGATLLDASECPVACESLKMCSECLARSECGWCASEGNGAGACTSGNVNHSYGRCDSHAWHYLTCPAEDECTNGHHNCDAISERCVDLLDGFRCVCAAGYRDATDGADTTQKCRPICEQGCVFGTCIHPDICRCHFGYVGADCSIACNCSGHSECAGPAALDTCLRCMNNTRGDRCEKCEKFFVRRNGKCESCSSFCHGHTDVCVGADMRDFNGTVEELRELVSEGPMAEDAVCLSCGNFTSERRCDSCISGFFRGTSNLSEPCRKCMCNGHGDTCDPVTGEKCNCGNNTESDQTCPAASSKSEKNAIQVYHCYQSQCAKCRESYSGHPKNGHQCYKHITIESRMCLNEARPFDECEKSLEAGKMQFFVVQPRFMNVDIRIIVDVTEGEIDLQMTNNDDSFVVYANQSSGSNEILLDSKYQWVQDDDDGVRENLNITPLVTSSRRNFDSGGGGAAQGTSTQVFRVVDRVAGDALATHITLKQPNMLLRVFGMRNRLVITLPQNVHNLSGTRFFVAIRAVSHARTTSGLVYFRQDQLHIDLFVFFSVFFSCFFLFLAVCVVVWKAKQAADLRRARQRHVVEMFNMAQRPYSSVTLDVTRDAPTESQNSPKTRQKTKMLHNYVPVAIESTSDNIAAVCTIFVRLPETKQRRRPVCLGSALISAPKPNIFLNKPLARIAQQNV